MSLRYDSVDELPEPLRKQAKEKLGIAPVHCDDEAYECVQRGGEKPKQNKYHVAPAGDRTYKGMLFASKREASKCAELDLDVMAGEIDFYLRQVPFDLGAGVKYVADFVTFKLDIHGGPSYPGWWIIKVIEVKMWRKATSKHPAGFFFTPEARLKMKLFKEKYPDLELEVCK